MIKINIRKVLFILVCAELLIVYYGQLEVRESRRQVVYQDHSRQQQSDTTPSGSKKEWKKAS
ncbi:hypothetical protein O9H85_06315 [Paenibacillus filicis]|uniref:Uncharacterized protein n=1 Tax=Paenibacillus gyeongsangnamensis TaxID=3388067 RepID=A0ABT4Q5H2_9BACL|nr:hypothetical protein [Paenibacillus filicis]MCZ8512046.1 hypothetical protein [Paenibacillus filicis]